MAEYTRYAFNNGTGTTRTVTFDEPTPLDDTHVLVAFHAHNQNSDPDTPSGWTLLGSAIDAGRRVYAYARRGNGSVNSISLTSGTSNLPWMMSLVAYKSDEGALAFGFSGEASQFSRTSASSSTITLPPGSHGVGLSWLWVTTANPSRTWAPGFTETRAHSNLIAVAEAPAGPGGGVSPGVSWESSSVFMFATVVVPVAAPPASDPLEYFTWDGTTLAPVEPLGVRGA